MAPLLTEGIQGHHVVLLDSVGRFPDILSCYLPGWDRYLEEDQLLNVIAPDRKTAGQAIANFGTVVKGGELRRQPMVATLVDDEMRGKMRSRQNEALTEKGEK